MNNKTSFCDREDPVEIDKAIKDYVNKFNKLSEKPYTEEELHLLTQPLSFAL